MNLVNNNNNISPLPIYDSLSRQNHRKDYAFGQVYPLVCDRKILPFQAILPSGTDVTSVVLHDFNTGAETDVTASMKAAGLKLVDRESFKVLVYPAYLSISGIKAEGRYYLSLAVGGYGTVYSEVFTVMDDVSRCLMIEYGNSYDMQLPGGTIDFASGFKFRCYLQTQLGKPEYQFEEEATERLGYTFVESQVSKKLYRFTFVAPEFLCDALRIVRLCDSRKVVDRGLTYTPETFSMDPAWEEQGDLAGVDCEFEADSVIAGIGGASFAPEEGPIDFNNDFN